MDYKKYPGKTIKKYNILLNNSDPIISIITPYYNAGSTIDETYNSIMSQTYPFFEWIIVNDGSPDKDSVKKLDSIEKKDSRIRVFSKENGGPSLARDYGIEKISESSKYVFFLDADDTIDPTMLECLYWALETNPDASFAYTALVNFGSEEYLWEKYLTIEQEKEENLINIASMVRKEDLLEVGCFGIKEKAMYEDWNLWLKLISAGKKPLRISAPLFWYRKMGESELSRANKNRENAMKYVRETASTITNNIEPIQYPRYGSNHPMYKEYDMVLPDYEKDKRKTILYMFPWMVVGGADYFNLDLIKRLDKDKYRAIILTTSPNDNVLRQEFEDYAEVYDMSSFIDRINYLNFTDYIISSRKVDLVFISNTLYGYYMIPYLKTKYPNIPFIDYIHSIDRADPRFGFGRASRDVDSYLYGTYCCNGFTRGQLINEFNKKNVNTIYIGTDSKKFDPSKYDSNKIKEEMNIPKDKIIISFIARLSREKRPKMFIKIAKKIHDKYPNTYFIIAGDGPLMNKVKSRVDDNFKVLGMIKDTEKVYAVSDITINCSSLEGLALTSYESLSMGVPIVSSDVGGQTELIDDTVGRIVHYHEEPTKAIYYDEIDDYVNKCIEVINDLDNLKDNCRKHILRKFTLDHMAKEMDKLFDTAIKTKSNTKYSGSTILYEMACESFNDTYFKETNSYYENKLGVYLTANKSKYSKYYKKIRDFLSRFGAVNEGKDIVEFLRAFKRIIKEFGLFIIRFFKAILGFIMIICKFFYRLVMKLFN